MSDFESNGSTPDQPDACRICGERGLESIQVKEMMFGLREPFLYKQCGTCGCLQIAAYPEGVEKYYPRNYYSLSDKSSLVFYQKISLLAQLKKFLTTRLVNFSKLTRARFLESESTRQWLKAKPVAGLYPKYISSPSAKILDVGCGKGSLLEDLYYLHYTNIHGCDPFIADDVNMEGKIFIRKAFFQDLTPSYDCISFHHVLEHMPNQLSVLSKARELLATEGLLMVRIPVVNGAAWRAYRANWVQLDPPRHYYLHSEKSFRLLAERAGLEVESIEYDSSGFQFWGSEIYCRDVPLLEAYAAKNSIESFFTRTELEKYEARAIDLNRSRDGDQIVAILRKGKVHTAAT